MLIGPMHDLWLSYQQLNPDIRRCMEYCSIFPKGSKLRMVELVHLWIAQGFVKISCGTEDIEYVAQGYIQELVSCSLLRPTQDNYPIRTNSFTVHDALHDLLGQVTRNCFRIENKLSERGEAWEVDVPRDIQHLLIQNYDGELIAEKIFGLQSLLTLIVYAASDDKPVSEKVIRLICKRLPKLRVLAVAFNQEGCPTKQSDEFVIPDSICQLKNLRYFAFKANQSCSLLLPRALNKLHQLQVLDFGDARISQFMSDDFINLRHIICNKDRECPSYIGRFILLQTIPKFRVSGEQGHEINQLKGLNKLCGSMHIVSLGNVTSKEEALEANLAAKVRLKEMTLEWCLPSRHLEVQAEVLEGLCPPVGLQELTIKWYAGLRYPDWMECKHNGGPKDLQVLQLHELFHHHREKNKAPQIVQAFPHLRVLSLSNCTWDYLPGNMEHLTSLKKLEIELCINIWSLPTLPRSLEEFHLSKCNRKFMKSCAKVGSSNWQKIEHIPKKTFNQMSNATRIGWKIAFGIIKGSWLTDEMLM